MVGRLEPLHKWKWSAHVLSVPEAVLGMGPIHGCLAWSEVADDGADTLRRRTAAGQGCVHRQAGPGRG